MLGGNNMDNNFECCNSNVIHSDVVTMVKDKLPKDEVLYDLAEFFKVFGDSTRMKIINVLLNEELCVSDISDRINVTQSAVSHQLRILKTSKLVKYRKDGNLIYYSLDDMHVEKIFKLGCEHINEVYL